MNIILSTYNFYPSHRGGTEIYTKAFAYFLISRGHKVLVIAADDSNEPNPAEIIFNSDEIRAISYSYEAINVVGIYQKRQSPDDIYINKKDVWTDDFKKILLLTGWDKTDTLILNGFNTVSGISLIEAVTYYNYAAKISVLVHTPFICPKADMIYSREYKRCDVVMSPEICGACITKERINVPYSLSYAFQLFQKYVPIGKLIKITGFRLNELLTKKFNAFEILNKSVTTWIVFSFEMKEFLRKQSFISPSKIGVIRHGIDKAIFFNNSIPKETTGITFLYSGRFEEIKGIKVLCDAWLSLEDLPGIRQLYLAGNWNATELGKIVVEKLSTRKDVIIKGSLSQEGLVDLYRKTHCVIIPSTGVETGPMVYHEAIACGCDIITSNVGGQLELSMVYKDKSFVFENKNKESLTKIIEQYRPTAKTSVTFPMSFSEHFESLSKELSL